MQLDEYGEFITPGLDDVVSVGDGFVGFEAERVGGLPGLTEEAQRLTEVGLAELAEAEQPTPVVPLAVSAFLTSRKRSAAAELADWIDSAEGRASSLESIGRALSRRNHGRSRAVVMAHDHDEAIKGLRALADGKMNPSVFAADGPATNGPVWVLAGFGALVAEETGAVVVSTTYRLSSSCVLQFESSTEVFGSVPNRTVPDWCATPATPMSFFR